MLSPNEWSTLNSLLERIVMNGGSWEDKATEVRRNVNEVNLEEFAAWFFDENEDDEDDEEEDEEEEDEEEDDEEEDDEEDDDDDDYDDDDFLDDEDEEGEFE